MRLALLALLATACAYDAGTFHSLQAPFHGQRVTIGCLDLSVARAQDSFARGAVVELSFGNRCEHALSLDLATIPAVAHGARLQVFDPRGEIEVADLPARVSGSETFEYRAATPEEPLCLDVGGVNRDEPRQARWVCL